jgi:hypothetical protein
VFNAAAQSQYYKIACKIEDLELAETTRNSKPERVISNLSSRNARNWIGATNVSSMILINCESCRPQNRRLTDKQ